MLSKPTQGMLVLYFVAMIALHGDLLWQSRQSIPQGLPDFSSFYTAGRILRDGQGSRLYDDALQESVQRSFSPSAVQRRGAILPCNHPPFEAVIFVPLAHLSYVRAYAVWLGVNLALLFSIPLLLRKRLEALGKMPLYLWLLAPLAFFPAFIALLQGQDSIFLLFLYCLAYVSLDRRSELWAGGWLAAGLYKYHLVFPFVLPLWRRKKVIAGFLIVAGSLLLISLAITGWQGLVGYPRYVWETEHNPKYLLNSPQGLTANLRGLITAMVPAAHPEIGTGLILLFSVTVLLLMMYAAGKTSWGDSGSRQAILALNLVGTILISYHIYVHDLSLLFLAILLVLEVLLTNPHIPSWTRTTLYICIAILFFSPLYLLLSLRHRHFQLMALVLLAFFVGLLSLINSLRAQTGETVSPQASAGR
jgi:hypothetical protein